VVTAPPWRSNGAALLTPVSARAPEESNRWSATPPAPAPSRRSASVSTSSGIKRSAILGVEVAAAIALVWLTRQIRRRRAAAGACTTCRFRCQQALAARPKLLVNVVDRRQPAPERPTLTCHPAAPLLPTPVTAAGRRLRPALRQLRPAAQRIRPALPRPRPASALPWGHAPARFMGPVPAPFSVRGPIHPPVSPLPPSATRVSSPTPAPASEPESVDVDGYVITPDGVDTAATELLN
jgi:hypothetical protein